ncbi:MAG: flagellar basal body rod protein FlgB [Peptococcales bacterium]
MGNGFWQNPTMDILKNSLDAVSLRHKTIANNMANINTPNYKRQLVNFETELAKHLQKDNTIPLKTTNKQHFPLSNLKPQEVKPLLQEEPSILRTDGNNVDIDLEMALLAENTVRYNVVSQTIGKKYSMLRSVIQGGR